MEAVNFRNSRGLNLVGDFYGADTGKGIVLAHGFTGDRHEWGRFDRIAEALNEANYGVLTFDFSGCGESDDDSISSEGQIDDLGCAIQYARDRGFRRLGLFGHSFGGLISLRNYADVETMVLTAPVTDRKRNYGEEKFSREQTDELRKKGYLVKTSDRGARRVFVISKDYVKERETLNQDSLLSPIKCPILIIHGDIDETVPVEWSKSAVRKLPEGSKLEIISGAGHDFVGSERVIEETIKWFGGVF